MSASPGAAVALETAQGGFSLEVGPGALSSDVELTVAVREPGPTSLTALYELGPDGLVFSEPVAVRIRYTGPAVQPVMLHRERGGEWEALGTAHEGDYFVSWISHFSEVELRDLRSEPQSSAPPEPMFPEDCAATQPACEATGACDSEFCFLAAQSACYFCPSFVTLCSAEACAEELRQAEGCEPAGEPTCLPVCLAPDNSVQFCE